MIADGQKGKVVGPELRRIRNGRVGEQTTKVHHERGRFADRQAGPCFVGPAVVEVGRKYFRVDEYGGRLHPIAADARRFLRTTDKRYDLVFGDAYVLPEQLDRSLARLFTDEENPVEYLVAKTLRQ